MEISQNIVSEKARYVVSNIAFRIHVLKGREKIDIWTCQYTHLKNLYEVCRKQKTSNNKNYLLEGEDRN